MLRRLPLLTAIAFAALLALGSASALATPVSTTLTAVNGFGTFDDTIGCPLGDGPSWRYAYSGTTSASSPLALAGTWSGTTEVHDGGFGFGFTPVGTGRVRIATTRGNADLEFGRGDCTDKPLTISTNAQGDPVASGVLPLHATSGTGSLRGLTGTGTANVTLELGPGADNTASIAISGNLGVMAPNLTVGNPSAIYNGLGNWLSHKASVSIPVSNVGTSATVGDAFDVKGATVTINCSCGVTGTPASLGQLNAGANSGFGVTVTNVNPGSTYTITVTLTSRNSLDGVLPNVVAFRTVKFPGGPSL